MNISITIAGTDRTSDIVFDSIQKTDAVNEEKDTLIFSVDKYADRGFVPEVNQEVAMEIDGVKEFGGAITQVKKSLVDGRRVAFEVTCCDYTQFLARKLVLESYSNQTVNYIIADLISKYAEDFTVANVDCDITIKTMMFNRMSIPECLEKIAKETGYYWYVDYDKDIHFFAQEDNVAPFGITDDNGKSLRNSLKITDNLDQIRNSVTIRGSEERGTERTEIYVGTADQTIFPLANKFAEEPAVEVDGTPVDVGVDYLTKEDDADCFWSYEQKSLRFKASMAGKKVEITGIPLFPILVKIPEPVSINQYGIYEFFKEDKSITSRAEAYQYATAQLNAYKDGVIEGEFQTDTPGLRSGQIINVYSDLMGVDEDFLIQRVTFKPQAKDKAIWSVKLATMRTMGIIQILQDLIRYRTIKEFDPENLLTLAQFDDQMTMEDVCTIPKAVTSPPYKWGAFRWGFGTWSEA